MEYHPQPMDLSGIKLDQELEASIGLIARSVHEVWAQERLDQGWRYGERMSREDKTHPSLVPYEELPEEEKIFDIRTAQQVIKMLVYMGYCVEKV